MTKGAPRRLGRVRTNPRAPSCTIQPVKRTNYQKSQIAATSKTRYAALGLCSVVEINPRTGKPYSRCLRNVPCELHPDGRPRKP